MRSHPPHAAPVTPHSASVTPHSASVTTPHAAPVTPHAAPVTPHAAPVTPHAAPVTPHSTSPAATSNAPPRATPRAPTVRPLARAKPYMSREERGQRARHDRIQLVLHADNATLLETTITRGARSEELAVRHLVGLGYRIVERNFRTKLGELDIIAREGTILVFVEVRSRSTADYGQAIEMVNIHKQRRVTRMARQYLKHRQPRFEIARFDVIGITAGELVHIKDAFRLG